jgi:hypothetical protein
MAAAVVPRFFVVFDQTFTFTEEEHGFHYFEAPPDAPSNWVEPDDYWNGTWHVRYEILSQPTEEPCMLQIGIWQDFDYPRHWLENVSKRTVCNGPGVYENADCPSTDWWRYKDNPLDLTRPKDFYKLGIVLWTGDAKNVSDWVKGDECGWDRRQLYLPMKLRVTVAAVPASETFQGW